ncbi:nucleoside phosphorylase domain-containing protein [Flagelloscypha sp. PMI_526]|nr:nucleoside phosphorylase domain-containing protein [Flagelloscypha sp. PMI_526]
MASVLSHMQHSGDPFSEGLRKWLGEKVKAALDAEGKGTKLFEDKCIVCMEGPQFSTRAESNMYRAFGGDLINMRFFLKLNLPRKLKYRQYGLIAMATDYDSWRVGEEAVTAAEVFKILSGNANTARFVIQTILPQLYEELIGSNAKSIIGGEEGSMKFSIMPQSDMQKEEDREKLRYILKDYF